MKTNGQFRRVSSRLHSAIAALPQAGLAAALFLVASDLGAQTTITSGENLFPSSATLGALTRNTGGTAIFTGTASFTTSTTNTNGILGPWAIVQNSGAAANGSSNGYTYATVTSGSVAAYTAATSQTLTTAWGGVASGGTGTVNYDLSGAGTLGATGLARNINTIRYTGGGARQPGNNAGDLLTINGIMNSGTGAFTLGRNGANVTNDFSFGVLIGSNRDLVLAPMTSNIVFYSFIKDGTGTPTAGAVTVTGNNISNTVELASASNAYTGVTTVAGATLLVSGTGSINTSSGITVNGSTARYLHTSSAASTRTITLTQGTVDGTGTLANVNVADNSNAKITNGNGGTGTLTIGNLTFNGDATINANWVSGSKALNVTGTLATTPANGTVTLNIASSGWATGVNNIIGFGTFSGSASDFTLGTVTGANTRQSVGGLSINGNNLALTINGDNPKWTGAQSGAWTTSAIGGASNWKLVTAGTATDYLAGDEVLFDDTATGTTNLDISTANVAPATTTFNNSAKNYTVSSSGGFGISNGSLTKNGTGSVTLATSNTYAGSTTLNGGTLVLDNASAIGTGTLNVSGGTLDSTNGTALSTNNAVNLTGNLSFAGTSNLSLGNGTVTLSGERAIDVAAGTLTVGKLLNTAGGFTKNGAGTLQINPAGVSTLAGTLTINAGTVGIGAQDLSITGLAGSGTLQNGSATNRWVLLNTSGGNSTFNGTLQDGGTGRLGLSISGNNTVTLNGAVNLTDRITVNGASTKLILNGASSSSTAATVFLEAGGSLFLNNSAALAAGTLINLNGAQTANVTYATDGGDNAYQFSGSSNSILNVTLDRATAGANVTHNLSSPTVGGGLGGGTFTFNLTKGANVSGTATASFDRLNLGGGSGGNTTLNPAAGVTVSIGSVTKSNNNTSQNLVLDGVGTTHSITGSITNGAAVSPNSIGLIKSGASTWTLGGTNSYSGTTAITGGTLLVNGDNSAATGAVTVASGATLGGSGTIGGATTVNGILSPGNSPGVLTFSGALALNSGSTSVFEINGLTRGTEYDGVNVGGSLTYGGTISLLFGAPITAGTYDLFGGAFGTQSGDFANVSIGGSLMSPTLNTGIGWTVTSDGWQYDFVNATGDLTISAVPEPASFAAFAGLVGLGLAATRRRRS